MEITFANTAEVFLTKGQKLASNFENRWKTFFTDRVLSPNLWFLLCKRHFWLSHQKSFNKRAERTSAQWPKMMEMFVFLYEKDVLQNVSLHTWNLVSTISPVIFQQEAGISVSKFKIGKEKVFSKRKSTRKSSVGLVESSDENLPKKLAKVRKFSPINRKLCGVFFLLT